ncbi:hypothetical protein NPIL_409201 [Nephila pilipes]|uniref:Uncharacterized protein n=1 Tax=Nephila pilipes TaxID=299642 RepID=A0A8X6QQF5_NEPPI|nr:hypothetical protein NPIL_409201 [Nephila pilipes]
MQLLHGILIQTKLTPCIDKSKNKRTLILRRDFHNNGGKDQKSSPQHKFFPIFCGSRSASPTRHDKRKKGRKGEKKKKALQSDRRKERIRLREKSLITLRNIKIK